MVASCGSITSCKVQMLYTSSFVQSTVAYSWASLLKPWAWQALSASITVQNMLSRPSPPAMLVKMPAMMVALSINLCVLYNCKLCTKSIAHHWKRWVKRGSVGLWTECVWWWPQSTYIRRVQSCVWCLLKYWPYPLHLASVSSPRTKGGGYRLAGLWGGWVGSILFWRRKPYGWPLTIISLRWWPSPTLHSDILAPPSWWHSSPRYRVTATCRILLPEMPCGGKTIVQIFT